MSPQTKAILMNHEVIAIDQDPLGKQASPIRHGDLELWTKPLADGGVAAGLVNLGSAPAQAALRAADLNLPHTPTKARDLWSHTDVQFTRGAYTATIPAHGILLLRLPPH